MSELLRRTSPPDLEVRAGGEGRTVYGIAVPYDDPTPIRDATGDYLELFRRGSFAKTIRERGGKVKALLSHDARRLPVGRTTVLREDAAGLYVEMQLSKTRDADEALELVRDGALDAFSIGFVPIQDRELPPARGERLRTVERVEAALREISLVTFGAYSGALVAGVRNAPTPLTVDVAKRRLDLLRMKASQ